MPIANRLQTCETDENKGVERAVGDFEVKNRTARATTTIKVAMQCRDVAVSHSALTYLIDDRGSFFALRARAWLGA